MSIASMAGCPRPIVATVGFNIQADKGGMPEQEKLIVPENPVVGEIVKEK